MPRKPKYILTDNQNIPKHLIAPQKTSHSKTKDISSGANIFYDKKHKMIVVQNGNFYFTAAQTRKLIKHLQKYLSFMKQTKNNWALSYNADYEMKLDIYHQSMGSIDLITYPDTNGKRPEESSSHSSGSDGYVYIIQHHRECKIGKTKDLRKRIGEYTKMPYPPEILCCEKVKDYKKAEASLHELFKDKRLRGEWFNLSEKDINQAKIFLEKS